MLGISIKKDEVGIGDTVQYSSLPENYYKSTGERLIDVSHSWIFDHNPYVVRGRIPDKNVQLINWKPQHYEYKNLRAPCVYLSNAESHAQLFNLDVHLARPRLYCHEDFPYRKRSLILFHPQGISQNRIPDHVAEHVIRKYDGLVQIGLPSDLSYGIPRIETPTIWDLVKVISQAKMLIGMCSGPAWIAACYPDIQIKKINSELHRKLRVPLNTADPVSHFDDLNLFQIYNTTERDYGISQSYTRI